MTAALRAEWTKLRTLAGTAWLLLGAVAVTVAVSAGVAALTHVGAGGAPSGGAGGGQDPTRLSLSGIDLGQAVVAVLAVLAVSDEYSTGMIRVTLLAIPRRLRVLAAKATNLAGLTLGAGVVAVAGCLIAGRLILPGSGLGPANGYALVSLAHGPTLRAAGGSVLYLVLIALFSLGVATAARDPAVSIGAVLGLLYLPPLLAQAVSDPLRRHLEQIAPMTAGLGIEATTDLRSLALAPWEGLGVSALWAVGALLVGGLVLRLRDA